MSWLSTPISNRFKKVWHEMFLGHRVRHKIATVGTSYRCDCGKRWVIWRD